MVLLEDRDEGSLTANCTKYIYNPGQCLSFKESRGQTWAESEPEALKVTSHPDCEVLCNKLKPWQHQSYTDSFKRKRTMHKVKNKTLVKNHLSFNAIVCDFLSLTIQSRLTYTSYVLLVMNQIYSNGRLESTQVMKEQIKTSYSDHKGVVGINYWVTM